MAMTSGCDTSGVNKFHNLSIEDPYNPPHTLVTEPSASDGLSNWRILTWCLQIYSCCAYTQLQLNDSIVGLCTVYVMYGFCSDRTSAGHSSITGKMTFSGGYSWQPTMHLPQGISFFLFMMKPCCFSQIFVP